MVNLIDLDPRWVGAGGEGIFHQSDDPCPECQGVGCSTCHQSGKLYVPAPERHGVGISFLCPCPICVEKRTGDPDEDYYLRVFVSFKNPLDGGPPHDPRPKAQWDRTGETFETLTLRPSILRLGGCAWHGFITNGVAHE